MAEEKAKIVVLLHAYYLDDSRVRRHCEWLAKCQKDITVICLNKGQESKCSMENDVRIIRAPVSRSESKSKLSYMLEYFLFFLYCCYKATVLSLIKRPKLIIVNNMPNALVFAAFVPRILGVPVLLDVHDLMPELCDVVFKGKAKLLRKILLFEEKLSFMFASHLMTVSYPVKKLLKKRTLKPLHVTHNSPSQLTVVDKKEQQEVKILFHGNIHERYGVQRLIEPLSNLEKKGYEFSFDIFGKGPYTQELIKQTASHDFITYQGSFMPVDVPNILSSATVGVIMNYPNPSNDFALPVKMLEYVANRVPVICPKLPIIKEYFSEESVFYFTDDSDLQ